MNNLEILPVKKRIEKENKKRKLIDEKLPKIPFFWLISSPPKSGKSNLICNLLYRPEMYYDQFSEILFISPTVMNDKTLCHVSEDDRITKITDNLDQLDSIIKGIIEFQKNKGDEKEDILLILDDCLGLMNKSLGDLSSRYRHYKISCIVSSQNFRKIPLTCRYCASSYILFKTNNEAELNRMNEELGGIVPDFKKHYNKATSKKYGFLYLNLDDIKCYNGFNELLWSKDNDNEQDKDKEQENKNKTLEYNKND